MNRNAFEHAELHKSSDGIGDELVIPIERDPAVTQIARTIVIEALAWNGVTVASCACMKVLVTMLRR